MDMDQTNRTYEIEIVESNLHKYKFLRFMFKQDLHRTHNDTIYAFLRVGEHSELLPMKPTPTQVCEFIEYRIRLKSEIFTGTTRAKLIFHYPGKRGARLNLTGLMFGPNTEDTSEVVITPLGFNLQANGGGITSPIMGYIPVAIGEVVTVKCLRYNGAKVKKVTFEGDIYDENGKKYPPKIIPDETDEFKVKYINAFENCQIVVTFGEG